MNQKMKKALLIGINDYKFSPLKGPGRDAKKIAAALSQHYDETPNFKCKLITSTRDSQLSDAYLRGQIQEFFKHKADTGLLFFSGHGSENALGGFLVAQNATVNNPGVAFSDIVMLANQSPISEIVIILDCCHSGHFANWNMGTTNLKGPVAYIREGVSILASSRGNQYSIEKKGEGLFTDIICKGLYGGAADIKGDVSVAGIYAFADHLLGPWDQRPIFKSHISQMNTLRKCKPKVPLQILRKIPSYFEKEKYYIHKLDPSYEPSTPPINQSNEIIFSHLQLLRDAGLIEPVGEQHLYYAAVNSKACQLTNLGRFYWDMVTNRNL